MNEIPERDWKVFSKLHGDLVERFCERVLDKMVRVGSDENRDASERLAAISKLARSSDKELDTVCDHRRSTAFWIVARLYDEELLTEEEFAQFSEETRTKVLAWQHIAAGE